MATNAHTCTFGCTCFPRHNAHTFLARSINTLHGFLTCTCTFRHRNTHTRVRAKTVICFPESQPTDLLPSSHTPLRLTHTHTEARTRARTTRLSSGKGNSVPHDTSSLRIKRKATRNSQPGCRSACSCKHALKEKCVREQKSKPRYRSLRVGSCWMLGLVGAIFLQQLFDFLLSLFSFLFFPLLRFLWTRSGGGALRPDSNASWSVC